MVKGVANPHPVLPLLPRSVATAAAAVVAAAVVAAAPLDPPFAH